MDEVMLNPKSNTGHILNNFLKLFSGCVFFYGSFDKLCILVLVEPMVGLSC